MVTRVVMPKLTDTMEEGVVLAWKKHEGDPVMSGDILAEIETDKAVMDLEAFGTGILRKVLAREGETVKSGSLIGVIGELDEDIEPALTDVIKAEGVVKAAGKAALDLPREEEVVSKTAERPAIETPKPGREEPMDKVRSSDSEDPFNKGMWTPKKLEKPPAQAPPKEKSTAQPSSEVQKNVGEREVERPEIKKAGLGSSDIDREVLGKPGVKEKSPVAKEKPAPFPQDSAAVDKEKAEQNYTERPLSQIRKAIVRNTTQSKAPVPHFYLSVEIDMEEAERLRAQFNQSKQRHLTLTDICVRAAAVALQRHQDINVSFAEEVIRQYSTIDIGVAVALDDGLISPVVRDCAEKDLFEVSEALHKLIVRAKTKRLIPEDYSGATFTLSNLGMYGVDNFIALLMPPAAAAFAIGTVRKVPVVDGEEVTVGQRMSVTMSCDHRVLDGAQSARFLQEFKDLLEQPLQLFLPIGKL